VIHGFRRRNCQTKRRPILHPVLQNRNTLWQYWMTNCRVALYEWVAGLQELQDSRRTWKFYCCTFINWYRIYRPQLSNFVLKYVTVITSHIIKAIKLERIVPRSRTRKLVQRHCIYYLVYAERIVAFCYLKTVSYIWDILVYKEFLGSFD
jgi:hypothetical protein